MNPSDRHPTAHANRPDPELEAVERLLEARGAGLRHAPGLADRLASASAESLAPPATLPYRRNRDRFVVARLALAAGLLIACALTARLVLDVSSPTTESEQPSNLRFAEGFSDSSLPATTERDTVLVTLLDAGRSGRFANIDDLEGSDPVGAAFAPLLGTTGTGLDDYMAEIAMIETEFNR